MATDLTYSVARELLWGEIGGRKFVMTARSGGGRGSLTRGVAQSTLSSYSPTRAKNDSAGIRGGAIPPGTWTIRPPKISGDTKGPWVSVLVPDTGTRADYPERDYDVERFKIHGTGPLGSDGCLVIDSTHRIPLLKAVKKAGGATLTVLWDGVRMNERLEAAQRNANIA